MKKYILITGANGEVGYGLVARLSELGEENIITLDLTPLDKKLVSSVEKHVVSDVLDRKVLNGLFVKYNFKKIFHLAALLSTSAERDPVRAHHVNTDGAIYLLSLAERYARENRRKTIFIFPSSIAVYGMPNLEIKKKAKRVKEPEFNTPSTMYGCNKIYVELLGNYYSNYYKKHGASAYLDFRSVRFPGLISSETLPTGGTSDFGPEMIHAAAQGKTYASFVRRDSSLPFMVMPDAVKALIDLSEAKATNLSTYVYNVGAFSLSAGKIEEIVSRHFSDVKISYKPDQKRQAIVDSWPADVDDSLAKSDWGWNPDYDLVRAFGEYLIPAVKERYKK